MEALQFLAAPLVLGFLLIGIHAYLGLHVLKREVIFVDISLSQVAALGGALSLFVVYDGNSGWLGLSFSLGLCLFVAFSLALLKHFEKGTSQEALIGMTYALASGALVLVADKLPHGPEHLKEALVGNILFITWPQVLETAVIYAIVGLIHWVYRQQFWRASSGEAGYFWWDFLFYFLFGVVITFSTRHAGVLVVFAILVAPAALATRFVAKTSSKLFLAWIVGSLGLSLAFLLSYFLDLPAGATVVCTLTGIFFLSLLKRKKSERGLPSPRA